MWSELSRLWFTRFGAYPVVVSEDSESQVMMRRMGLGPVVSLVADRQLLIPPPIPVGQGNSLAFEGSRPLHGLTATSVAGVDSATLFYLPRWTCTFFLTTIGLVHLKQRVTNT